MTTSLADPQSFQNSLDRDQQALQRAGLRPLPAVSDPPPLHLVAPEGQLQVHTAPYRGSFASVLSQAMRAAGLGSRVLISQFLKGGVQQGPAGRVQLCGGLVWLRPEVPLCLSSPGHPGGAEAVAEVWSICRQHLIQGDLDQLVLDELGLAVAFGYLDEADVIAALEQRPASMDSSHGVAPRFLMLKCDRWITEQAGQGMIEPFQSGLVRHLEPEQKLRPVLSFGCSSYGYDLRLSPQEFLIFRHVPGTVMNPKRFNPANLEPTPLHEDEDGRYFILPAHSYGLGVALEKLRVPPNITVICLGKSTYARLGIIVNTTPAEASWEGHLTLEFSNSSGADCRIYADEGICQLLFFEGDPCSTTYSDRQGKYQHQPERVTLAKV